MNRTPARLVLLLSAAALLSSACKREGAKIDELEKRISKLEAAQSKLAEVEEFVRPVMEAQKEDARQRAASEPAPNARFAVNIEGDDYHGPETAAVTIIEAWDFA